MAISFSRGSSQCRDWTRISGLLHWQEGSLPLVPQGKPKITLSRTWLIANVYGIETTIIAPFKRIWFTKYLKIYKAGIYYFRQQSSSRLVWTWREIEWTGGDALWPFGVHSRHLVTSKSSLHLVLSKTACHTAIFKMNDQQGPTV